MTNYATSTPTATRTGSSAPQGTTTTSTTYGTLATTSTTTSQNGTVVAKASKDPTYGEIVSEMTGKNLYLLSSEGGGKFSCTAPLCTEFWPPLLVPAGTTVVTGGPGVAGKLGLIARPEGGAQQVTYNGYPLYKYSGDTAAGQTSGEGVNSFGGTWYLIRASSTTVSTTAVTGPSA